MFLLYPTRVKKGQEVNDNIPISFTLLVGSFLWTIRLILTSGIFLSAPTNTFPFKPLLISFPDSITYDEMQQRRAEFKGANR